MTAAAAVRPWACALALALAACGGATQAAPTESPVSGGPPPSVVASTASPPAPGMVLVSPRMVDDEAESVVLMFGIAPGGAPVTETWDGQRWTYRQSAASPPASEGVALAYDSARKVVVLFGGTVDGSPSAQTWTWQGGSWTQQHPSTSPPPRAEAGAAFDPVSRMVLLFGGCCSGEQYAPSLLSDTWAWDGTNWSQLHPSASPPARQGASLVDDPGRHRLLLFGGSLQGKTTQSAEAWAWDGKQWTGLQPARSPAPDASAVSAAPHHASQRVLAFLGYGGAAQTWLWDGATWTLVPVDFGPPARTRWVAAEDLARGRVVLFDIVESEAQTWTWDGTRWTQAA
jgi:hypothetical protein